MGRRALRVGAIAPSGQVSEVAPGESYSDVILMLVELEMNAKAGR